MNDCNEDFTQTDEDDLLRDEVSDEAVEAASVAPGGFPTLLYRTYCFTCPSRPTIARLPELVGRRAPKSRKIGAIEY